MNGKRYTEPQILEILGQIDAGQPLAELTQLQRIAVSTIHRWKAKYSGMTKNETKRFHLLEDKNRRLKKLVADLSLDKQLLEKVVAKNGEPRCDASIPGAIETAGSGFRSAALERQNGGSAASWASGDPPTGITALGKENTRP
jgi:putative transposase